MITVFSFIGSMAGEKSRTARYSDNLAQVLREMALKSGEEVSYERITGDQIRLEYCRSCGSCFKNGTCPLDDRDDMDMLKEKMLGSDILFFGSPVYMGDMSGLAKNVIDRIAYWAHRYELAGKPAVVFATTDSSFGQETADHMAELLSFTGMIIVHKGHAKRGTNMKPNLYIESDMRPIWEDAAGALLRALRSPASCITDRDELKFQIRKRIVRRNLKLAEVTGIPAWNECYVMKERGVLDAATYADYLEYCRNICSVLQ